MEGRPAEDPGGEANQAKPGPVENGRIGRYQIQGELGRGAMGVVYLAIDPAIGRRVAIKTIRIRDLDNQAHQQKLRERLFREARSAGVLSHPNIVTIYDMDEDEGVAYIAMEFVNGRTLDNVLSSPDAMAGAEMLRVLRQCASALDYANGRGVIHRDVKPGNIMLDENGAVKITDFGIAKLTAPSGTTETRTVTGTPSYMSPEQVQGLAADGRSDQFSLAVIAYEILSGERPFHGEHLSTIVYRIVAEEPTEVHRINDTLAAPINVVLRKALAKNPDNRFPTCASFVGALELACAESRGWRTIPSGSAHALATSAMEVPPVPSVAPQTPPEQPPARPVAAPRPVRQMPEPAYAPYDEPAPRRQRIAPVLAGVFVALGMVGVFAWEAGVLPGFSSITQAPTAPAPLPSLSSPATSRPPTEPPVPAPVAPSTPESVPDPAIAAEPKPNPLQPPVADLPGGVSTAPTRTATSRPRPQDVWVTTNPPGAKVVFDDDLASACLAPCMLHGPAGVHHLNYSLGGYKNEYREIRIGDTAIDAPLVTLRQPTGTLLLTTSPPGASIRVDGKSVAGTTPTQIALAPGTHTVTVERAGYTQSQQVEMQESPVYLRFTLGP